jgi:hypothetical protein
MFYKEQLLLFILFSNNEDTFKGHHYTWHSAYNMHEKEINLMKKKLYMASIMIIHT